MGERELVQAWDIMAEFCGPGLSHIEGNHDQLRNCHICKNSAPILEQD
jgi:hypothetical protein